MKLKSICVQVLAEQFAHASKDIIYEKDEYLDFLILLTSEEQDMFIRKVCVFYINWLIFIQNLLLVIYFLIITNTYIIFN